jgi:3-deoxy-D-manno-octulosonic acid kinase
MNPVIHKKKSLAIVYDASSLSAPAEEFFKVDFWRSRQQLAGEAMGRGSAWFIDAPVGPMVLRQYLRGGWAARLSRRHYLFTIVSRSRSFREFNLLAALHELGLPVPRPYAALTRHHGLLSTGAIVTAQISNAYTLADVLPGNENGTVLTNEIWRRVGRCIRRFHTAGVRHADLNARNILLDSGSRVFLIDFDRARYTPGKAIKGSRNLGRLKRSLDKLWPQHALAELKPAWDQLEAGYNE